MQHGESGGALPRQASKIAGKDIRDRINSEKAGRRWHGTPHTMFQVAEADMSNVKVESTRRRTWVRP